MGIHHLSMFDAVSIITLQTCYSTFDNCLTAVYKASYNEKGRVAMCSIEGGSSLPDKISNSDGNIKIEYIIWHESSI